jgi:hypothetical protein
MITFKNDRGRRQESGKLFLCPKPAIGSTLHIGRIGDWNSFTKLTHKENLDQSEDPVKKR